MSVPCLRILLGGGQQLAEVLQRCQDAAEHEPVLLELDISGDADVVGPGAAILSAVPDSIQTVKLSCTTPHSAAVGGLFGAWFRSSLPMALSPTIETEHTTSSACERFSGPACAASPLFVDFSQTLLSFGAVLALLCPPLHARTHSGAGSHAEEADTVGSNTAGTPSDHQVAPSLPSQCQSPSSSLRPLPSLPRVIVSLILDGSDVGTTGAFAIADAVWGRGHGGLLSCVVELSLSDCSLTASGVAAIASSLIARDGAVKAVGVRYALEPLPSCVDLPLDADCPRALSAHGVVSSRLRWLTETPHLWLPRPVELSSTLPAALWGFDRICVDHNDIGTEGAAALGVWMLLRSIVAWRMASDTCVLSLHVLPAGGERECGVRCVRALWRCHNCEAIVRGFDVVSPIAVPFGEFEDSLVKALRTLSLATPRVCPCVVVRVPPIGRLDAASCKLPGAGGSHLLAATLGATLQCAYQLPVQRGERTGVLGGMDAYALVPEQCAESGSCEVPLRTLSCGQNDFGDLQTQPLLEPDALRLLGSLSASASAAWFGEFTNHLTEADSSDEGGGSEVHLAPDFDHGSVADLDSRFQTRLAQLERVFSYVSGSVGAAPAVSSVECLSLRHNGLGIRGAIQLSEVLPSFRRLSALYLANNRLTDDGLCVIVDAVHRLPRLRVIDVGHNQLTNVSCVWLVQLLLELASLTEADGACSFAPPGLSRLVLNGNAVGPDGVASLLGDLELFKSLRWVDARDCNCGRVGRQTIGNAVVDFGDGHDS